MPSDNSVENRLGYLLKQTQHRLRAVMDEQLAELELTTPQYAALVGVEEEPGLSNAKLARRCFVTPQTMHRIVGRLEKADRLRRSPHPDHGRIQQLYLTPAGRSLLKSAHRVVRAIEKKMTAALSPQETRHAARALRKCLAALEEDN